MQDRIEKQFLQAWYASSSSASASQCIRAKAMLALLLTNPSCKVGAGTPPVKDKKNNTENGKAILHVPAMVFSHLLVCILAQTLPDYILHNLLILHSMPSTKLDTRKKPISVPCRNVFCNWADV